jgi:hypothetical protein
MDSKSLLFVPLLPGLFSKEIQGSIGVGGPTRSSFQGNSRKNGVVSLWVVGQLLLVHCSNKKTNPKKSWNSAEPEISVAIYACYSWQAFCPPALKTICYSSSCSD